MNLNAYDDIKDKIDKNKSWINVIKKLLLTREINIRNYYTLSKRYNVITKSYDYYIILLDNIIENKSCRKLKVDDYGRCKIDLSQIWNSCSLNNIDVDFNVSIMLIEHSDDGDIYRIDI